MKNLVDIELDGINGLENNPKLQKDAKFKLKELDDPYGGEGEDTGSYSGSH